MVEIEFEYLQNKIVIYANLSDYFSNISYKFYQKAGADPNSIIFFAHSQKITEDKKLEDIMEETEKFNQKIIISVYPININNNNKIIEQSKEIICPKCLKQCRIKFNDYFVELFGCVNNHITKMRLDEFEENQKIDLAKIKCDVCKIKNIGSIYNDKFFYCQNCKVNLCSLCKEEHNNNNHLIINYNQKNYLCSYHNEYYTKYCQDCKSNICSKCYKDHLDHNVESLEEIISDPDNKREELDKIQNEVNIFINNVKRIISGLNELIVNMESYNKILNNIYNNYDVKNKSYQSLDNMNQININSDIYLEVLEINNNTNYNEKLKSIFDIYYKMKGKNNANPFDFSRNENNFNNYETKTLLLFSDIPSNLKKETKISQNSIYRCNFCPCIPLMKIMYKGYKVYMEYRCQNGHYSYEKLYDFYQRNKINSINSVICCVGYEINDGKQNFYYCNDCQQYYCEKDKTAHEKIDDRPHNLINLKYINNICNEHLNIINDYCLDCHKNICFKCKSHSKHKKIPLSKIIVDDNKLLEYRHKLNELKGVFNQFYDECDKTIIEVLDYIKNFNSNLKRFKNVNDCSFNVCEDLLNSYQYLKDNDRLNYEVIENLNSILNFNETKFKIDKKFNCMAKFIYINSIIKLEYNTLFKLKQNFINFDYQITEEEEKLIISKNVNLNNLEYKKIIDHNFENTYYGYFKYDANGNETMYEINGFGIKLNKHYKYIGEFKNGKCHGYGVYYFESGAYKFAKNNLDTTEAFKLYAISGQIEFCLYTKIVDKYQKYGVYYIEMPNGSRKINIIKSNNFDDYGLIYNING